MIILMAGVCRMKIFDIRVLMCGICMAASAYAQGPYEQINLVSDVPNLAPRRDFDLVNPWGITFAEPSGPWWVDAQRTGLSILYDGSGAPAGNGLKVSIPPPEAGAPTGIVFNNTPDFFISPGQRALFIFASLTGTISAWNPAVNPTVAVTKVSERGAVYTGVTIGTLATGQNILYAANFARGIETFDTNFNPLPVDPAAFQDSQLPAGYGPYNVQNIGGSIFVTFALQNRGTGPGLGFVDRFSPEGKLLNRLQTGPWMNAPWGIVMAPTGFGPLSQRLLVGQFGSGQIASFDPNTFTFLGLMTGAGGAPITISGLWGIRFGNDGTAGSSRELFFAAGIAAETHGLFGRIRPAAVPAP
jgi:uncharacterized protein (TIGR03118 family)